MRKILAVFAVLSGLLLPIEPSNAALLGCPDKWPAPQANWERVARTSSGFTYLRTHPELDEVKKAHGFNVVIESKGVQFSKDGIEWIDINSHIDEVGYSYLLNAGYGRHGFLIKMLGCEKEVTRYYNWRLADIKSSNFIFGDAGYFQKQEVRDAFSGPQDFTLVDSISTALDKCVLQIQSNAKESSVINGNKPTNLSLMVWTNESGIWNYNDCLTLGRLLPGTRLFFTDSQCQVSTLSRVQIVAGEKCDLILGGIRYEIAYEGSSYWNSTWNLTKGTIYILKRFEVNGPRTVEEIAAAERAAAERAALGKTTISCIKGKSLKKVTGSSPKCPKGYKKK